MSEMRYAVNSIDNGRKLYVGPDRNEATEIARKTSEVVDLRHFEMVRRDEIRLSATERWSNGTFIGYHKSASNITLRSGDLEVIANMLK